MSLLFTGLFPVPYAYPELSTSTQTTRGPVVAVFADKLSAEISVLSARLEHYLCSECCPWLVLLAQGKIINLRVLGLSLPLS